MRLPIARWGRKDLALFTLSCLVVAAPFLTYESPSMPWFHWGAVVPAVMWLLLVNFFRDPERETPVGERLIVAPADGKVSDLEIVDEPEFLGGEAERLGIFLSPLDVHVNRAPMDCAVKQVDFRRGKMHRAYDPRARTENEAAALRVEVLDGRLRMIIRQVTGAVARRIVCPVEPGERFRAGERYGMIKFGSRTEVWVPRQAQVKWRVSVGDRVKGGLTVLGEIGSVPESGDERQSGEPGA